MATKTPNKVTPPARPSQGDMAGHEHPSMGMNKQVMHGSKQGSRGGKSGSK